MMLDFDDDGSQKFHGCYGRVPFYVREMEDGEMERTEDVLSRVPFLSHRHARPIIARLLVSIELAS